MCNKIRNCPANIYPLKVNNRHTKKWNEINSKLTIKTPDRDMVEHELRGTSYKLRVTSY